MASYKDPANLKFNPYVQQRPVEAMMKVGVYKQEKYNEGVQKIQTSIDNIAGLDVVRDVDKAYLQSKLNQLGSNLSNVAGGDFSNFQLVNSVNGMTNQIAKDPKILNAVGSSARYRKALESKDKITGEGKGSASNDFLFKKGVDTWLIGDANATYNDTYKPYTNYKKNAQDVVKNLVKDTTQQDVAFDFNANGNIIGIRDAITRTKIEGITPGKIQQALLAGLSPNDWQQLQIDGQYQYSNVEDSAFVNNINSSYTNTFTKYSEERNRLSALVNTTGDPIEQQKLRDQVEQLDDVIKKTRSEYNNISKGFSNGDVESAKSQLYTNDWMTNFSNSFSSSSVTQTYENNPFAKMQMDRDKMRQTRDIAEAKMNQLERFNNNKIEIEKEKARQLKLNGGYGEIGLPTSKDATDIDVIATSEIQRDNTKLQVDNETGKIASKYQLDEVALLEVKTLYSQGAAIRWDLKEDVSKLIELERQLDLQNKTIDSAKGEANTLYPNNVNSTKAIGNLAGKVFTFQEGGDTYEYDYPVASELFRKFDREYSSLTGFSSTPAGMPSGSGSIPKHKFHDDIAKQELSAGDFKLYNIWRTQGESEGDSGETLYKNINSVRNSVKRFTDERDAKVNKYVADYLKDSQVINQQRAYSIPTGKEEERAAFRPVLTSIASIVEDVGLPNDKNSADGIRSAAADLLSASVYTDDNGNYSIEVLKKDKTSISINIPQDVYDQAFQGRFDQNPGVKAFNQTYLRQMLSNQNDLFQNQEGTFEKKPKNFYTTSTNNEYNTTPENSHLEGPIDFPNVSMYGVSGNIVSNNKPTGEQSSFILQLNVFDPILKKHVLVNHLFAPMDKSRLIPTMQMLSDTAIFQLLNNTDKPMPLEYKKQLEDASKQLQ